MSLRDLQRDWTALGKEDPLWAVYVAPGTKGRGWDVDAFFATGAAEVAASLARARELGLLSRHEVALDFGCGVGRLSSALLEHVDRVVAVDISPTMLDEARRLGRCGDRCTFVLNDRPDLAFQPEASVDLVYSSLVLQHLPSELAEGFLQEFARVLRPGGVAVVQTASRPTRSLRGVLTRVLPPALQRRLQTLLLGYPAPMLMTAMPQAWVEAAIAGTGLQIAEAVEESVYGGHWVTTRYFLVRRS